MNKIGALPDLSRDAPHLAKVVAGKEVEVRPRGEREEQGKHKNN